MTPRSSIHAILLGALVALLVLAAPPALAANSAGPPQWVITSVSGPTYFKPAGKSDVYIVTATNVGGESTSGPVTITDRLPTGVTATRVPYDSGSEGGEAFTETPLDCPSSLPLSSPFTCTYADDAGHQVAPGDTLSFTLPVEVTGGGKELENEATVSGGGAATASTNEPTTKPTPVTSEAVPFGVASLFALPSTAQAGAHPNFTTSFTLNLGKPEESAGSPHEFDIDLPTGFTGDPLAAARCNPNDIDRGLCPQDAAVGVATVAVGHTEGVFTDRYVVPVYNITPYPNEPAALAFAILNGLATAQLDVSLVPRSDGEYAVHVRVPDVNQSEPLILSSVTLWGVPAEFNGPGPDKTSESFEREGKISDVTFGGPDEEAPSTPFLRNPTSCGEPLPVGFEVDSWLTPGVPTSGEPPPFPTPSGCELLSPRFMPALQVSPETAQADAPAGYAVNLSVPQSESPQTLATPDLKDVTVTLPPGTVASPSAASGLEACSNAEFGINEVKPGEDIPSTAPAACSPASQIGTVRIKTPLLEEELTGQVFLGQPECSPCEAGLGGDPAAEGRMLRPLLQVQYGSGSHVRIKLAGRTYVNEQTGQLTTVFQENPQQPFEKLTLTLDGGPTAPLANPSSCGVVTATSQLVPWSSTKAAPFTAEPSSSFTVGGCGVPQFAPSFGAGMTGSAQAGAYSPLSLTFSRTDQDQDLGGITVQMPPGIAGMVSHVAQCDEAQANAGTCPQASEIGTVTTGVGPGSDPFWISDGRAYLTGPYKGAPFGLSVVVPAVAGPFNLGEEIVRAAIYIDPHTSAVTVVSNPLPTMKDGIPFQIRTINVNVNRPQFTFNATNCNPMAIGATISSTQSTAAAVSSPYQATGCKNLAFKPTFTASTQAHTSKADGASLDVKIAYPQGANANIAKSLTELPTALPSRLTTLQKACVDTVFEGNPAACPEGSVVGEAIAHTPVLKQPLAGPAYLISHGGAAFPDLEIVLQGEGVEVILDGQTDIKNGITRTTFNAVPDAPVETFELNLPEGPHSALAANVKPCSTTLDLPTVLTGQNGAVLKQTTNIAVIGCPPTVALTETKLSGDALFVTLKLSAKGTVRISGEGLKTTTRKNLTAGSHQIRVALTKKGRSLRSHHNKASVRVSLTVGKQAVASTADVRL